MAAVSRAFSGKIYGAALSGIGRPSQDCTMMTSKVLGIAASTPTRAMRPATGQRSMGSMRPNHAAKVTICSQLSPPMMPK